MLPASSSTTFGMEKTGSKHYRQEEKTGVLLTQTEGVKRASCELTDVVQGGNRRGSYFGDVLAGRGKEREKISTTPIAQPLKTKGEWREIGVTIPSSSKVCKPRSEGERKYAPFSSYGGHEEFFVRRT